MSLLLVGMSHRSAPLALRERFAAGDPREALTKLVGDEDAEAVLVSTCNRVEAVVWTAHPDLARMRLRSFFERDLARGGAPDCGVALEDALYDFEGAEAARHVFRVASSIDSMVIGEPQILGQVKEAWRIAVECGACGSILSRLHERAFACAKRVRNETGIAERPVSVARVAAELAGEIFESLEGKTALLVGAGEMIELALEAMRGAGLARVRIANRTPARADALAERFDASAHGLDELPTLLAEADVVLTSVGGDRPMLGKPELEAALRIRRQRPIFVIDIGVPRNIDPAVNELEGVYLYDLDDLGELAAANDEERRREKVRAEAIVLEEQQHFDGWLVALAAVPTIRDLASARSSFARARSSGCSAASISYRRRETGSSSSRADRQQAPPRADRSAARPGGSRAGARDPRDGARALRSRRAVAGRPAPGAADADAPDAAADPSAEDRGLSGPVDVLRIATRGSGLARTQAGQVARALERALGVATELVVVRTTGDRIQDRPLSEVGGKGLFVKEIEEALLRGDADVAVHSAKDLPARLAAGLALAAFPRREDSRDALVGRRPGATLAALPHGARVGTGSVRRRAQLLRARADLEVVPLRGNVDTRLRKLEEEGLDAILLACAGLVRLGLAGRIDERLDPNVLRSGRRAGNSGPRGARRRPACRAHRIPR